MPAAVRGESRVSARPRAKASAKPGRGRPAAPPRGPQAASKLQAAGHAGLTPKQSLIAAGAVLTIAIAAVLGTGGRAEMVGQGIAGGIDRAFGALGFRLNAVHVQGASEMATRDILAATGLYKDQPILGLDLEDMRRKVMEVSWIEDARIVRLLPGTLVIAVKERKTLAVWQHAGQIYVVDQHGRVIPKADPARFASLPLVVGLGANEHAAQILPAIEARPRLKDKLLALVRVDDRRWDLRLKDGSLVQLPAFDEEAALLQLDQLDQRSRILELGFERIDLRDPNVVAVRPRDGVLPGQLVAGGA